MSRVTILRDRYVRGWPRHAHGDRAYVRPVGEALEREYSTDAHFAAYSTPNGRRLVREALDQGVVVELTCIVFDVDCPEGHADGAVSPAWRRALRERVMQLAAVHPAPFFYETRGGGRIVYRQEEPTLVRSHADSQEWSKQYAVAIAYLARRFQIAADPACGDWQRLFRLPRATREAGGYPENRPFWGDPRQIGALVIDPEQRDVERARRDAPRPFREPRELPSYEGAGDGLLFWALRLRGDVFRQAPRGGWVCRCPNRRQHSSSTDGSDSTVVYPAAAQSQIGAIHCKHAHCANLTLQDFLRLFTDAELDAARAAAGIRKGRAA